jgi:uncharacterized repeat protein (TIGR03843 family)
VTSRWPTAPISWRTGASALAAALLLPARGAARGGGGAGGGPPPAAGPPVAELAVLDAVVNNTDRKGSHVLQGEDGRAYGVDHGVCLHVEPKLRTVLWGWAGEPIPEEILAKLRALRPSIDGELGARLADHLTPSEVRAVADRTDALLDAGVFPTPTEQVRAVPWPLL